jgi:hypothetical protein
MFEVGNTLETWALCELPLAWHVIRSATAAFAPGCPAVSTGNIVDAEQLGQHRHAFLEFEGPLSGDRGHVRRIASGTYVTTKKASHEWRFTLDSGCLRGEIALQRRPHDAAKWVLHYCYA